MTLREETWFHPLTGQRQPPISRRRLMLFGGGAALATAMSPNLRLVSAQDATPPLSDITGDPEAVALLQKTAIAMSELSSFGFTLETTRGSSTVLQGLELKSVEGAVRRPFDFTATAKVGLPIGEMDITVIGLDGQIWAENPLSNDGTWTQLPANDQLTAIVNPDALVLSAVNIIQNAAIDGTEKIDGEETTVIAGTVNLADSAGQVVAGDEDLPVELVNEPMDVLIWINGENRILEIEFSGPLFTSESDDVVRDIVFFDFNEPVEIEPPPVEN